MTTWPTPIHIPVYLCILFRGSEDELTDEGLLHLTALRGLTHLAATPLGVEVSKGGVVRLLAALSSLQSLDVGLQHVGQVTITARGAT